jgi:hypothetical protein
MFGICLVGKERKWQPLTINCTFNYYYTSSHQENKHVGNNTGEPICEQATMASSSVMNQYEYVFVQNKEPSRGQSLGKYKAVQTLMPHHRSKIRRI